MKYLLFFIFSFILMIGYSSCKDGDDCRCPEVGVELTSDNTCRCDPDLFYQLGSFTPSCDDSGFVSQGGGQCEEKTARTYLMFGDCNCTFFTAFDSTAVLFSEFLNYKNKMAGSSATSTPGTFTEMADGNEFEYLNIKNDLPDNRDECTGEYFGLRGYMKGKFNAENTFCETKIYWRFSETSENLDSCTVTFRK